MKLLHIILVATLHKSLAFGQPMKGACAQSNLKEILYSLSTVLPDSATNILSKLGYIRLKEKWGNAIILGKCKLTTSDKTEFYGSKFSIFEDHHVFFETINLSSINQIKHSLKESTTTKEIKIERGISNYRDGDYFYIFYPTRIWKGISFYKIQIAQR